MNGFSLVWLLLFKANNRELLNDFSQNIHLNGFSPVWFRLCKTNGQDEENALSLNVHLNGLSPVSLNDLSEQMLYNKLHIWMIFFLYESADVKLIDKN